MTRYDPHPQQHDDARTGPQASREAAGRDETASRVSGDGQGLRGALEALAETANRLRAVLAAHPTPEPAADPGVDVVEQVEQVAADAWLAAVQKPGFISRIWRNVALALADAGLLVDPEVSERAERLPRLYRDLDGMRILRDEAVGERDRARHLAAALEADNAKLQEDVERANAAAVAAFDGNALVQQAIAGREEAESEAERLREYAGPGPYEPSDADGAKAPTWQELRDLANHNFRLYAEVHAAEARVRRAASRVAALSQWVDDSYPEDIASETVLWRRVGKVSEESGEVTQALIGFVGENPRKGFTHTAVDLTGELLDVAVAALAAVEHIEHNRGVALGMLFDKITAVHDRALSTTGQTSDATTKED